MEKKPFLCLTKLQDLKSQNKLKLANTRTLWAYLIFYNIATLERSWFNPGMEKYQK